MANQNMKPSLGSDTLYPFEISTPEDDLHHILS